MNYPEYIMKKLRQRLGLEENDTSMDMEINMYTPNEAFEEVLLWEGFVGWSGCFKMWIEDIYKVDLDEASMKNFNL